MNKTKREVSAKRRSQLKKEFADIADILVQDYKWQECFTPDITTHYRRHDLTPFSVYTVHLAYKGEMVLMSCGTIVAEQDIVAICDELLCKNRNFWCLFDVGGRNVLGGCRNGKMLKPIKIDTGVFSIINA